MAERELPDSQCGFRKGRSCTDMTFVVRQLTEKAQEYRMKLFTTFIDLKRPMVQYSERLCVAMKKLGMPGVLIDIVRAFHEKMEARVRNGEEMLDEIEVTNGLRQGCTMAPTLFNMYAYVVLERWLEKVEGVEGIGIHILYKLDQQLFGRNTTGACQGHLTECQFADNIALLASTRKAAEETCRIYQSTATDFGLTMSVQMTKFMVTGYDVSEDEKMAIDTDLGRVEHVQHFQYLGSVISEGGSLDTEIDRRLGNASKAFGALKRAVFNDKVLTISTKRLIYQACVLSVLLYGCECWIPLKRHIKRLECFHHRCACTVLGISNKQQWEQHISAEEVRDRWGDNESISTKLRKGLGHLSRMSEDRMPKKICSAGWLDPAHAVVLGRDGGMQRRRIYRQQEFQLNCGIRRRKTGGSGTGNTTQEL